jgi:sugar phosphate isomerase/epimerase
MKTGVLTTFGPAVEENIRKVADLGLRTCQLKCWNSAHLTEENADLAAEASAKHGVEITAFWVGWDGVSVWNFYEGPLTLGLVPPAYRAERAKMLLRGSEIAQRMGVTDIATHVGFLPVNPSSTDYLELVSCLKYICGTLARRGQYFLFETGQETPVTLLRIIEDIGTGNVGINLDPANLLMYGMANPVDALDVFGRYVRGVHGKDGEYPVDGRHLGREKPLGEGRVDYPRFVRRLKECGFDGAITIEREISGEKQIEDIIRARDLLEKIIAGL